MKSDKNNKSSYFTRTGHIRPRKAVKFMTEQANVRRIGALDRLNLQLASKVKTTKDGDVPLTESDTKRIKKEIGILESRIK
jgi:hypothetical protein